MWTWLKKKFSRKPEAVMPAPSATRPLPPPPPQRRVPLSPCYDMRGEITASNPKIGAIPIDEFQGFRYSNPSPVFSFDTGREASIPLSQNRVEVESQKQESPRYEPAPAREPVANYTYVEPASSYESSSSCDSSSYSSSDSGSSCSSD